MFRRTARAVATRLALLVSLVAVICSCGVSLAASRPVVFDVPRLEGIAIDADPADWGDRGFAVRVLPTPDGKVLPAQDLDVQVRLGWSEEGLLVLVQARDDAAFESDRDDALWEGDSVELFVSPSQSSSEFVQFIISPGLDPRHPDVRRQETDERADKSVKLEANIEVRRADGGYTLEALLPWANFGPAPRSGDVAAFQVYVNDSDKGGDRSVAVWHPLTRPDAPSRATHPIRLAEAAGPPVLLAAHGSHERFRRIRVDVAAVSEMAGKPVELRSDVGLLAGAQLAADEGKSSAKLVAPLPPRGQPVPEVAVFLEGERAASCDLPDIEQERARALIRTPFNFRPYIFSGSAFPACGFDQPGVAEDLLGDYTIETRFYDRNYLEVKSADTPGRYGAVVEIRPASGRPLTFYRTLFRLPEGMEAPWFPRDTGLSVELPPIRGVNPRILKREAGAVGDVFWMLFRSGFDRDPNTAALACALAETSPSGDKTTIADDFLAQDRQWWVGLKRKLYGMEEAYPDPFASPRPKEGDPTPALREGTPEAAGMDPEGVQKLDALLQEWAADTDEGFAVCLARHGVVFLHKAYGQRDGRPMTVTDKSWNASITKLLSATLTMMLVDQGRLALDDPVAKFLPPFRGVEVPTPMTIRHLYTHTCDLWDHWGDELHDFDQLIGHYYPYLDVGKRFEYNGAGYSIAGKIIEMVSGEAIPLFYQHHLLDPLGCEHLDVFGNSWDSRAAPMDLAKIAQLLLNRGSYGDLQLFSEETFAQMTPQRLTKVLGPDTTAERGIGVHSMFEKELGKGTFGHGAASSADLIISPEKDMVVVMTRNAAGTNFGKYHPQFIDAVVQAIADVQPE